MGTIVGLGGSIHDFATCVVTDDNQVLALEDERLTRVRYALQATEPCLPSLRHCLARAGRALADVDAIIGNDMLEALLDPLALPRLNLINHHLTHAYSTFFTSPFDEAAILVVDGAGSLLNPGAPPPEHERETTSYFVGRGNQLSLLGRVIGRSSGISYSSERPPLMGNSLGDFYRAITEVLGFGFLHAGKAMGLASYGDDRFVPEVLQTLELRPQGQFAIHLGGPRGLVNRLKQLRDAAHQTDDPFRVDAAIAFAGQAATETLIFHCLNYLATQVATPNLCLAGGVALNSMTNGKIAQHTPFKHIHVIFAPGDGGTALGAALWGALQQRPSSTPQRFALTPYLGPVYGAARARQALEQAGVAYTQPADLPRAVAQLLAAGKTVAWVQGGSEFGPRALGNRSILADPRSADMRDHINANVKQREWFRPLAPAVTAEAAGRYFALGGLTPWMQFVWPVRPEHRAGLAAVTHVDGGARVQTVTAQENPGFHAVLTAFEELSGYPVVMNTSFNTHGGPIVETPEQAIATLRQSELDALALEGYLVCK